MRSVLVGVDHSEAARRAVQFASELLQMGGWEMTLAYVIEWSRYSFNPLPDLERRPVERRNEIAEAQEEVIDPLLQKARDEAGIDLDLISPVIKHGPPSEVLLDLARERKVDLIVIGRTGESSLKAAIFGSVPNRLVQHAHVPVVVVP